MPHFQEFWDAMAALKASLPFAIALPILIALVFASIVDRLERRLNVHQDDTSQDWVEDAEPAASEHRNWKLVSTGRALAGSGSRNREHA